MGIGIIDIVNSIFRHLSGSHFNNDQTNFLSGDSTGSHCARCGSPTTNKELMLDALHTAGFVSTSSFSTYHSLCFPSRNHLWDWICACSPRVGKPLALLTPGEHNRLKALVLDGLQVGTLAEEEERVVLTNHGVTYVAYKQHTKTPASPVTPSSAPHAPA